MIGHFVCVGAAAAIIAELLVVRKNTKKREKVSERIDEYRQRAEYNKTHLPSTELPSLSPDWDAVNGFVKQTRFRQWDGGEVFLYNDFHAGRLEIPKSDFDSDTLKLIVTLNADVDWFNGNPTGERVWEESEVLERFLREKYPRLSDESISQICDTYCVNNR